LKEDPNEFDSCLRI